MNNITSITTKVDLPTLCPTSKAGTKLEKIESDFYTGENQFWQIPNQVGIKTGATLKEILASPDVFEIEYSKFVENKHSPEISFDNKEQEIINHLNNIIGKHIFSNIKDVYDYHFRLELESMPKEELIERIITKDKFIKSFFE